MKKISALSFLLSASFIVAQTQAHTLSLNVDKIHQLKGKLMIALYNTNENYKSNTNTFSGKAVPVTANVMRIDFTEIPSGEYAIKLFQDENENGKIDTNILGIPTEGYGFSNNQGGMGQPDFKDAKFSVTEDTVVTIHLR